MEIIVKRHGLMVDSNIILLFLLCINSLLLILNQNYFNVFVLYFFKHLCTCYVLDLFVFYTPISNNN